MRAADDFSRPVYIHICRDGTISYRRRGEKVFNGVALPVFTVDNVEQAEAAQTRFGRLQYIAHPLLPGKPWYRWTDFSGDVDDLDKVSDAIRAYYASELQKDKRAA